MRKQKPEHPVWVSNVQADFPPMGLGQKVKSTVHGTMPTQVTKVAALGPGLVALTRQKKVPMETVAESCAQEKRKVFVEGMP